jgi:hypothetical protein
MDYPHARTGGEAELDGPIKHGRLSVQPVEWIVFEVIEVIQWEKEKGERELCWKSKKR